MKDRTPREMQTGLEGRIFAIAANIQTLQRSGLDGYSQLIREIASLKVELRRVQQSGVNLFASIQLETNPQTRITVEMSGQDREPMTAPAYKEKVLGRIEDIGGNGALIQNPRVICLKLSEVHLTDDGKIDEIDISYVPLGAIKEITIIESEDLLFKRS